MGRHIRLRSNFFPLKIPDELQYMFHYDVEITPSGRSNRSVIDGVIEKFKDKFGKNRPAFDGKKNLYCCVELPSVGKGVSLGSLLIASIM